MVRNIAAVCVWRVCVCLGGGVWVGVGVAGNVCMDVCRWV